MSHHDGGAKCPCHFDLEGWLQEVRGLAPKKFWTFCPSSPRRGRMSEGAKLGFSGRKLAALPENS